MGEKRRSLVWMRSPGNYQERLNQSSKRSQMAPTVGSLILIFQSFESRDGSLNFF
ncbi:hypothetical protein Plhal304r1_c017g0062441 [Plasmopara halstedii]